MVAWIRRLCFSTLVSDWYWNSYATSNFQHKQIQTNNDPQRNMHEIELDLWLWVSLLLPFVFFVSSLISALYYVYAIRVARELPWMPSLLKKNPFGSQFQFVCSFYFMHTRGPLMKLDTVISFPNHGFHLHFAPCSQVLCLFFQFSVNDCFILKCVRVSV